MCPNSAKMSPGATREKTRPEYSRSKTTRQNDKCKKKRRHHEQVCKILCKGYNDVLVAAAQKYKKRASGPKNSK